LSGCSSSLFIEQLLLQAAPLDVAAVSPAPTKSLACAHPTLVFFFWVFCNGLLFSSSSSQENCCIPKDIVTKTCSRASSPFMARQWILGIW
jgi:hypothetical protein